MRGGADLMCGSEDDGGGSADTVDFCPHMPSMAGYTVAPCAHLFTWGEGEGGSEASGASRGAPPSGAPTSRTPTGFMPAARTCGACPNTKELWVCLAYVEAGKRLCGWRVTLVARRQAARA
ncbi:hypothetical protein EON68_02170 [archaeon]|nr:MAG: hypothetical protein EON68_02170 [archaeon]